MSRADEITRRILAPRPLGRPVVKTAEEPVPCWPWRAAVPLALLAVAAVGGTWFWLSDRIGVAPASSSNSRPAANAATTLSGAALAPTPIAMAATATPAKPAPLASLAELLLAQPSARWRWYRFKANPAIVVIEFPNLREQGLAMNRLAAMFEKRAAQRERVLSEGELADMMKRSGDNVATFYQGHDYPSDRMARFFSLAEAQRVALSASEQQLRDLLVEAGLMRRGPAVFEATGVQAAVSFSAVQPDDPATAPDEQVDGMRREAVLRHELSHGEFFTNAAYRAHCMAFWRQVLREPERRMFRTYLKSQDYNTGDEELMANETQALLMHTPDTRAFNAAHLGVSESSLAGLRSRFRGGEPAHGLASSSPAR